MKNRKVLSFTLLSILGFSMLACTPAESCKNCEAVTYDAGSTNITGRSDAIEYCGDDLFAKENTQAVVVGSDSTVWECL